MKIGNASAVPSTLVRGELALGEYPDGTPISSPLVIACGARPGPTLWLQGCVHGPETVGPIAINRFLRSLDLTDLSGTIACVMAANPLAFRSRERLTSVDGQNLNRNYPGRAEGGLTQGFAYQAFNAAIEVADVFLDLHSGGDHLVCCHHVIFRNDGGPAGHRTESLAIGLGAPIACNVLSPDYDASAFACFSAAGKPGVLIESGGGAVVTEADVDNHMTAIRKACEYNGMLAPSANGPPAMVSGDVDLIYSSRGGIFEPTKALGSVLSRGDAFGVISNLYGDVVETCRSPADNVRLVAVRRAYMPVYAGEEVAEITTCPDRHGCQSCPTTLASIAVNDQQLLR